jgi:ubiquinone/menaquinone biosynthesis C-methylase UbiE
MAVVNYDNPVTYDIVLRSSPFYQEIINALVEDIAIFQPSTLINLGSGTGFLEEKLLGAKHTVFTTGIEKDPITLAYAQKKFQDYPQFSFQEGTVMDLDVEDEMYDMATSVNVLFLQHDPQQFIREAFRVLKPLGTFAISSIKPSVDFQRTKQVTAEYLQRTGLYDLIANQFEFMANNVIDKLDANKDTLMLLGLEEICDIIEHEGGTIDTERTQENIYLDTNYLVFAKKKA